MRVFRNVAYTTEMKKRDPEPSESRTAAESRTCTPLSPQAIAGITAEFKATKGILAVARKKELAGVWNCTEWQVYGLYTKLRAAARTAGTMPAPKKSEADPKAGRGGRDFLRALAPSPRRFQPASSTRRAAAPRHRPEYRRFTAMHAVYEYI